MNVIERVVRSSRPDPGSRGRNRLHGKTPSQRAFLSFLSMVAVSVACSAAFGTEPVKRAVLVGVDEYRSSGVRNLAGCVNDVELMKTILVGKFEFAPENVLVLRNDQATRAGILRAIRSHLIEESQAGDITVVHFSGHGSQMIDVSGDELDGMDETIVPHDSRQGDVFDISDDEINGLMRQLSEKTPHVAFILDSCHSGSAARAAEVGNVARQTPPDCRQPPSPEQFAQGGRGLAEGPDDFRLPGSNYVLISGCKANELSNETAFGNQRHGAMTYFLARALRAAGDQVSYRDVMEPVKADVSARFPAQHPQMEGAGIDTLVFGDKTVLPRPYVLVEPKPGDATAASVAAGEVYGLTTGARLDVYPPATKVFDGSVASIARVRIEEVAMFSAGAQVESGMIEPHSRAVLDEIRPPDFMAGVFLQGVAHSDLLQSIRGALADHESVKIVENRADAHIRIREADGRVLLEGRDLEILSDIASSQPGAAASIVERIAHWGRWFAILSIDNPSPEIDIDLSLQRAGVAASDPPPGTVIAGTEIEITVTNRSNQDIHAVVLDLASDGSISVLYPPPGINDQIPSNKSVSRTVPAWIPDDRTVSLDYVKAIATTQPIDPAVFQLGPVARSAAPTPPPGENALEGFLRSTYQGLTRNLGSVVVDGWAVEQRLLRTVRPTARTTGFMVHFENEAEAVRAAESLASAGSRSVCDSPAASKCYAFETVPGEPTMIEVRMSEARSTATDVQSVGEAFEEAYAIREARGAVRAEPLLDQPLPWTQAAPLPDSPESRGFGGGNPDPRAASDPLWSLKYVRVPEAWESLRSATGASEGEEADGIVIAHPDTGYLEHPEIWEPASNRPIWSDEGYDYFAGDDDSTDDLIDERPLDHPAHGTGSGSAIVSHAGCQIGGASKCPTGGARGAHLVPLRINRSVVNFSAKRLTQAILDASGSDRTRIKVDTDLASIAMGGPPSWALWKAVKKAEERGYLVVAAAGNYVRIVAWPARFKSVVAVAAVNAGCKPWAHTSLGSSVDFSAPGESVWRATLGEDGGYVTGMGTGTTYATATTAGVAALWVAKHKDSQVFQELKQNGELTRTFRRLAQQTSWRPGTPGVPAAANCDDDAGWRPQFFGSGIIDAAALLAAPIDTGTTSRSAEPVLVQDLPLWFSLYEEKIAIAVARDDYRRLFELKTGDDLETVAIYEAEVTYHYAMSEAVLQAIDEIVLRGNRTETAYTRAREVLRAQDLSASLRRIL